MVGGAFVKDHRRAERERPEDEPGTHHPADVGVPEHCVIGANVESVRHVLRGLDGEAAVHVDCALRLAGGARRVDDHQRVLRVELVRGRVTRLVLQQHLPHLVTTMGPGDLAHHPPVDDDLRHGRAGNECLVGRLFHRHDLAAAIEAVGADEHLGLGVLETRRDGLGAVARKDRDDDRADLDRGEDGDRDLGTHRHVDADAIARSHSQTAQGTRQAADLFIELAIGELADVAGLTLPDERELVVELAVAMAVEAALHDVHAGADPPPGPGLAVRKVDDLVVVAVEGNVDVLDRSVPEPLDVIVGSLQELAEGLDAVMVHEAFEPAAGDDLVAGLPDHVPDHDRLHGL